MKIAAITTLTLMAGAGAYGQSTVTGREITVCTEGDASSLGAVLRARALAWEMFDAIGVTIDWRPSSRDCFAEGIVIDLSRGTPDNLKPGALAYARAYEGTYIQVFYDRISRTFKPDMVSTVLAHVLAHEITHILQGINRHSEQGVMKAHWDETDYFHMRSRPLGFTQKDMDLIYRGLAVRSRVAMAAMNAPSIAALETLGGH